MAEPIATVSVEVFSSGPSLTCVSAGPAISFMTGQVDDLVILSAGPGITIYEADISIEVIH